MKNQLTVFPAIFTFNGEYYNVDFIDIKGCSTYGDSFQDALLNAQNTLGLFLSKLTTSSLPDPTLDFSNINLQKNQFISCVYIDMSDFRDHKLVKKTLVIPAWLNSLAEKNNINFSQTLREALEEKIKLN